MNHVDYAQIFISMIAIVNPVMGVPMFVSLTNQMTSDERHRAARAAAITVFTVLGVSIIAGDTILGFFGINVMDFSIAGGILILLMAINMLNARTDAGARISADERLEAAHRNSVAIVPIGIPLLAGPGAISTAIIFSDEAPTIQHRLILIGLCLVIGVLTYFTLRVSRGLSRLFGITGMNIFNRIMGLLLAAVAVSFIVGGVQQLFPYLVQKPTPITTPAQ
ncbi:MAG: NAAT family transporter [Planctomycetota bacterium]|nr:NAAT family transporter [Planctomycetota bacterium]